MPINKARYYRRHRTLDEMKKDTIYHQKVLDIQVVTQGYSNTEITNTAEGIDKIAQYKRPVKEDYKVLSKGQAITTISERNIPIMTEYLETRKIGYEELIALFCSYCKESGDSVINMMNLIFDAWQKLEEAKI